MRRMGFLLIACLLFVGLLAACGGSKVYQDGEYRAEFAKFDSYGYKDYLTLTVEDGSITKVEYNARDAEGLLRTEDEKYAQEMEAVRETYPELYTTNLINQLLEKQDIEKVDMIAGATYSSDSFKALFTALEENMQEGNTELLLVENVPTK